jgi:hypothetical protein
MGDLNIVELLLKAGNVYHVPLKNILLFLLRDKRETGGNISHSHGVGFDPDTMAADGCTALHVAAQRLQLEVAKLLMDSGACVIIRNNAGKVLDALMLPACSCAWRPLLFLFLPHPFKRPFPHSSFHLICPA